MLNKNLLVIALVMFIASTILGAAIEEKAASDVENFDENDGKPLEELEAEDPKDTASLKSRAAAGDQLCTSACKIYYGYRVGRCLVNNNPGYNWICGSTYRICMCYL